MNRESIKEFLKCARSRMTPFMPADNLEFLAEIREHELSLFADYLPGRGAILEIGAGTGCQSMLLNKKGYRVDAIDIPRGVYGEHRVWPVKEYDGINIPYGDSFFDCVFSSNTLEHIPNPLRFQREILRVLKHGGMAIHLIPSPFWRIYSMLSHPLRYWTIPPAHGTLATDPFSEIYFFSAKYWVGLFRKAGFEALEVRPNSLFYTGNYILGKRLSLRDRERISRFAGNSSNIYFLRKPVK